MVRRIRNWNVSSVTRRRGREVNGRLVFVETFIDLTACFCGGNVSRVACRVGPVAETVRGIGGHGCGLVGRTTSNDILLFVSVFVYIYHPSHHQRPQRRPAWHRQCFTSSVQERTSLE